MKIQSIYIRDTDSNFLYVYPFYEYCSTLVDMEDTNENRFITCNIVMYLLTKLVGECYETLTSQFGIEDPTQRKIIKMKNE